MKSFETMASVLDDGKENTNFRKKTFFFFFLLHPTFQVAIITHYSIQRQTRISFRGILFAKLHFFPHLHFKQRPRSSNVPRY